MRNIPLKICQISYRRLIIIFSLLMYVGSAHGMFFLMNVSTNIDQLHAMHSKNHIVHDSVRNEDSGNHVDHLSAITVNQESSMQGHDMESCLDHCLASVAISYELSNFISPDLQSSLMTSLDVSFYSLPINITSPPPKFRLS